MSIPHGEGISWYISDFGVPDAPRWKALVAVTDDGVAWMSARWLTAGERFDADMLGLLKPSREGDLVSFPVVLDRYSTPEQAPTLRRWWEKVLECHRARGAAS